MKNLILTAYILLCAVMASGQVRPVVVNGVSWYDNNGEPVNAHGACIVEDGGKYWLFGEYKSDTTNVFQGFSCYSSVDLASWTFENIVLPQQDSGMLGPESVGERVKVMKCPLTGEYIMLMHTDNLQYINPVIGIATCNTINGDYKLQGPILFNGEPIKRWDMGTFQDNDGTGYLLVHHGPVYKLSDDYRYVVEKTAHVEGMGESPAMFRQDGVYFLLTSNLTSWERNDNYYFTAANIKGPWVKRGLFCPEGSLTYNSQSTFVLPIKKGEKTVHVYMGDRWSYPAQKSAGTYVWNPVETRDSTMCIPEYYQAWDANTCQKVELKGKRIGVNWHSNEKGRSIKVPFEGGRIGFFGKTDKHGGYADVAVTDKSGKKVFGAIVDCYSKVPDESLRFLSPEFAAGSYVFTVKVTGKRPEWSDKRQINYGSDDYYVDVIDIIVID